MNYKSSDVVLMQLKPDMPCSVFFTVTLKKMGQTRNKIFPLCLSTAHFIEFESCSISGFIKIYNMDKERSDTCMSFLMDTHGMDLITLEIRVPFLVITGNYSI